MAYRCETFTVPLESAQASDRMGGVPIIVQHELNEALNTASERGSEIHAVLPGPDYVLVVLRRGDPRDD
jgi:hypothetical protein